MSQGTRYRLIRAEDDISAWRYLDPLAMVRGFWGARELLRQLTRREVQSRYRGSRLGFAWALLTPLLTLGVFALVFGAINGARWVGSDRSGILDFTTHMFVGIVLYGVLAECAIRGPLLIAGNPNYVKKTVFPIEAMPVSVLVAAGLHSLVGITIALACILVDRGSLPWTVVLLPAVYAPILLFSLAAMWLLSTIGVFFRDVANLIGVAVQLLFFLTPVAYPLAAFDGAPRVKRLVYLTNPMATIMENARHIVVDGRLPDWTALGVVTLVSAVMAMVCYAIFMKLKRDFADAI